MDQEGKWHWRENESYEHPRATRVGFHSLPMIGRGVDGESNADADGDGDGASIDWLVGLDGRTKNNAKQQDRNRIESNHLQDEGRGREMEGE